MCVCTGVYVRVNFLHETVSCLILQGNLFHLQARTGWFGDKVLYFGDHVYTDLAVSALHITQCTSVHAAAWSPIFTGMLIYTVLKLSFSGRHNEARLANGGDNTGARARDLMQQQRTIQALAAVDAGAGEIDTEVPGTFWWILSMQKCTD